MKIADVKKTPSGETTINYSNGYTFIGEVDKNGTLVNGTIKTPTGEKYNFANLERVDIYDIMGSIENGDFEINRITELI